MRKILFYAWCIGGFTLYGFAMRWIVRSIADTYGLGVMAIAIGLFGIACYSIARRMDRENAIAAAADCSIDYRPARTPEPARLTHSRLAAD